MEHYTYRQEMTVCYKVCLHRSLMLRTIQRKNRNLVFERDRIHFVNASRDVAGTVEHEFALFACS